MFDAGASNKTGQFQPGPDTNIAISDSRVSKAEKDARLQRTAFEKVQRNEILQRRIQREKSSATAIKRSLRKVGQFAPDEHEEPVWLEAWSVALGKVSFEEMQHYGVPKNARAISKFPQHVQDQWTESDWAEYVMLRDEYKAIHEYPIDTDIGTEQIYDSLTVYKLENVTPRYETGRTKSRACVVGTLMKMFLDITRLHASTGKIASLRFCVAYAVQHGMRCSKLDMKNCYLQFLRTRGFWMRMFPRLRDKIPNTKLYVTGNLYGAPDASKFAEEGIAHELCFWEGGVRCLEADYSLYIFFRNVPDPDAESKFGNTNGMSGAMCIMWTHSDDFVAFDQYDSLLTDKIVANINKDYVHPTKGTHKALPLQQDGVITPTTPTVDAVGFQIEFEFTEGVVSRGKIHCNKYKEKCAKKFFDTTCDQINGCDTPMIPKSVLSTAEAPATDEERRAVHKQYPGNFYEWAGSLLFGTHGCGPQYLPALSQLQRHSQNPSAAAWKAMIRLMKTWLSKPREGITATKQTDVFLADRIVSSFDSAFACDKEMLEYKQTLDKTLAHPRVGGVISVNGMPFLFFSFRWPGTMDNTSAAETAALHHGATKANWSLKLVSYFTPATTDIEWKHTPPQAIDGTPVLSEQDNKGCIFFAFNPVSNGRLINQTISMAVIRENIELHRLRPFKVPSKDMVSNVMTKNETAPDYAHQTAMLIGDIPWESMAIECRDFKPAWCKFCGTSDIDVEYDNTDKLWFGTCNMCGVTVY